MTSFTFQRVTFFFCLYLCVYLFVFAPNVLFISGCHRLTPVLAKYHSLSFCRFFNCFYVGFMFTYSFFTYQYYCLILLNQSFSPYESGMMLQEWFKYITCCSIAFCFLSERININIQDIFFLLPKTSKCIKALLTLSLLSFFYGCSPFSVNINIIAIRRIHFHSFASSIFFFFFFFFFWDSFVSLLHLNKFCVASLHDNLL